MNNRQDLWDQTVQTELNAQQLDAWKKETDAREDYRGESHRRGCPLRV